MAVVIRLARHGKKKTPFYRIVATESTSPRDGRYLEVLGNFDPKQPDAKGLVKKDRVEYWISKGAKPSLQASQIIKRSIEA